MTDAHLAFIAESNRIEGIHREPLASEVAAHHLMWGLNAVDVADLERFVQAVAGRSLRRHLGQDVRVGAHIPPPGGPSIERDLNNLLAAIHADDLTPYEAHHRYEHLHPFMDGNGRSGRALWAWHMMRDGMDPFSLPFLHRWYYQSLDGGRAANVKVIM